MYELVAAGICEHEAGLRMNEIQRKDKMCDRDIWKPNEKAVDLFFIGLFLAETRVTFHAGHSSARTGTN